MSSRRSLALLISLTSLTSLTSTTDLVAQVAASPAAAPRPADGWTTFRGPKRDNLSPDKGLLHTWPEAGPKLLWQVDGLGLGFSSVSFAGDRIFTLGDVDGAAMILALALEDGRILWSTRLGPAGGTRNPGPRSTPTTDGAWVYAIGHDGSLACVDAKTGAARWRRHLIDDFGGRMMSKWGYSESPLLDGKRLVCMPGGARGSVIALDKDSGKEIWRCTGLTDPAAYTSLVPVEIHGVAQYLVFTGASVAGVAATDGKLLWRGDRPGRTAICSTPVYADGYLFVSSGYNVGCTGFRISADGDRWRCEKLYAGNELQSHHGGLVLVDGYVYGLGRRQLKCIDIRTGEEKWAANSVGKGSIAYADGHLVVRSERGGGSLALVEATPLGHREKGRFDPPARSQEPAWAYPVIWGGRLYIRDQGALLCYDLRAPGIDDATGEKKKKKKKKARIY